MAPLGGPELYRGTTPDRPGATAFSPCYIKRGMVRYIWPEIPMPDAEGLPMITEDQLLEQEVKRHISITTYDKLLDMLDQVVNWGRRSSLWPMQFGLAC